MKKIARFTVSNGDKFWEQNIDVLELKPRSYNGLMRNGIKTLNQLTDMWNSLGNLNAIGELSVKEIRNAFIRYYLETADEKKQQRFLQEIGV